MSAEQSMVLIDQKLAEIARLLKEIDAISDLHGWIFTGGRALVLLGKVNDWIWNREFNVKFGEMHGMGVEGIKKRYHQIVGELSPEAVKWANKNILSKLEDFSPVGEP